MGFGEAITSVRNNLTTFTGRARRSEYWWWYLFIFLVALAVSAVGGLVTAVVSVVDVPALTWIVGVVVGLAALALWVYLFIGTLAVAVRRMHDQDKSGLFLLLAFVPFVGGIIVLVFLLLEGTQGPNQYGPDPRVVQAPQGSVAA